MIFPESVIEAIGLSECNRRRFSLWCEYMLGIEYKTAYLMVRISEGDDQVLHAKSWDAFYQWAQWECDHIKW